MTVMISFALIHVQIHFVTLDDVCTIESVLVILVICIFEAFVNLL